MKWQSQSEPEHQIKELIDAFVRDRTLQFEQQLFAQNKRLADAERAADHADESRGRESAHRQRKEGADQGARLADLRARQSGMRLRVIRRW